MYINCNYNYSINQILQLYYIGHSDLLYTFVFKFLLIYR